MDAYRLRQSRYQREQRITVVAWMVVVAVGGSLAAYHHWSTDRSTSYDQSSPSVASATSMRAWLAQSESSINRLVRARNEIAAAASRQDIPATGSACQTATDAVANLRDHMPSPEAAVNQPMQLAISSYTTGLPFCVSASGNVDGQGMQLAARLISEGDTEMRMALDALQDGSDTQPGNFGVLIV